MTAGDWIALTSVAVLLAGIGIRLIVKATRLADAIENLDQTIQTAIKAGIRDHERRMHADRHRRAG